MSLHWRDSSAWAAIHLTLDLHGIPKPDCVEDAPLLVLDVDPVREVDLALVKDSLTKREPRVRGGFRTCASKSGHFPVSSRDRLSQAAAVDRGSTIVRSIWAACLLVAGLNHARLLLQNGLSWDYSGLNPISAAYQSSLTLINPLVAALLFIRPRVGIVATVALIVTNVTHNVAMAAHFAPAGELLTRVSHPITLSQIGFMLFVLAAARIAWRGALHSRSVEPSSKM